MGLKQAGLKASKTYFFPSQLLTISNELLEEHFLPNLEAFIFYVRDFLLINTRAPDLYPLPTEKCRHTVQTAFKKCSKKQQHTVLQAETCPNRPGLFSNTGGGKGGSKARGLLLCLRWQPLKLLSDVGDIPSLLYSLRKQSQDGIQAKSQSAGTKTNCTRCNSEWRMKPEVSCSHS